MGKLNIAHHKSYHPYRRDNIERVRRDEEEARLNELKAEGRMKLADSEARMDLLRARAGLAPSSSAKGKQKETETEPLPPSSAPTLTTLSSAASGGHINLFADIEASEASMSFKSEKAKWGSKGGKGEDKEKEDDKGVRLGPSKKDLNPWYTTKDKGEQNGDGDDELEDRRKRDLLRKAGHDPLTSINHQLSSSNTSSSSSFRRPLPKSSSTSSSADPERSSRLSRESSERERALALIRRKQREKELAERGSMTPSTVYGGDDYGDMYNRREVEEARERKERWRDRRW